MRGGRGDRSFGLSFGRCVQPYTVPVQGTGAGLATTGMCSKWGVCVPGEGHYVGRPVSPESSAQVRGVVLEQKGEGRAEAADCRVVCRCRADHPQGGQVLLVMDDSL